MAWRWCFMIRRQRYKGGLCEVAPTASTKKGCEICWVYFPSPILTPPRNGGQGRPIKPEMFGCRDLTICGVVNYHWPWNLRFLKAQHENEVVKPPSFVGSHSYYPNRNSFIRSCNLDITFGLETRLKKVRKPHSIVLYLIHKTQEPFLMFNILK